MITPVKPLVLKRLLAETNYDKLKSKKLVDGFTHGFDLGYRGPLDVKKKAPNLKLTVGSKTELWNKVMNEVKLGRYAGPYESIPFENYIQSPIGLVPKDNGTKTRLIFHLSYPRNDNKESVNANTPDELAKVNYTDFDEAVKLCLQAGKGCHAGKSDLSAAFRHLCLAKEWWKFLVMKAQSPMDGKTYYFVDKCLPFGARISCALFQDFSDALAHIIRYRNQKPNINYLDDFFFVQLMKAMCDSQIQDFVHVCNMINFPVSKEKTVWGTTCIVFLGIMLDTYRQIVCVPLDKVVKARDMIKFVLDKKSRKITLKQLQKLCGYLNFLCKCIVPGRAFTRRMYNYGDKLTKPNHHLRVTGEFKMDLSAWDTFLQHSSAFSRPFFDFHDQLLAEHIDWYTDASANPELGMVGICGTSWFITQWDSNFMRANNPSINYLELLALAVGVFNWLHRFRNKRIIVYCDNESVVYMVNQASSKCPNCMVLIRLVTLQCLIHNVKLSVRHISGKLNIYSDMLSRLKYREFWKVARRMNRKFDKRPDELPEAIWPVEKSGSSLLRARSKPKRKLAQNNTNLPIGEISLQFGAKISIALLEVFYIIHEFFVGKRNRRVKDHVSTSTESERGLLSTEHLRNILDKLRNQKHKSSTRKMHYGVWRKLNEFLVKLDYIPPAWEDKIALYCAYLVSVKNVQSSTLKSYLSAIKSVLADDGFIWEQDKVLLSSLIRSCKYENDTLKNRLPIRRNLLELILFHVEKYYLKRNQVYLCVLYKAILIVMYYGLMRVGEVVKGEHVLLAENVHQSRNDNHLMLVLYHSKTHGVADQPQKIRIYSARNTNKLRKFYCPVETASEYIKLRAPITSHNEQFFVFSDGSDVTPRHVRNVLRNMLRNLDLNPKLYDTHSFRIGRATDLGKREYPVDEIMRLGRWKSNAVFAYLRQ